MFFFEALINVQLLSSINKEDFIRFLAKGFVELSIDKILDFEVRLDLEMRKASASLKSLDVKFDDFLDIIEVDNMHNVPLTQSDRLIRHYLLSFQEKQQPLRLDLESV